MNIVEIGSTVLLVLGSLLLLTGSIGILRLPDFYSRLHAAGKTDTLAQALILVGLILRTDDPMVMIKLGLLSLLLFVTAPTSSHAVTKAAHLDGLKPFLSKKEPKS